MSYWVIKSEPSVYSIDHLAKDGETVWDGIRNYQARIYLRSAQVGDRCFFYHSNTDVLGLAGLCEVVETMVVDPTQFDPASDYFDPKSTPTEPRWHTVRVKFVEKFTHVVTLEALQSCFNGEALMLVRKGNRLSITPVSDVVAEQILQMAGNADILVG